MDQAMLLTFDLEDFLGIHIRFLDIISVPARDERPTVSVDERFETVKDHTWKYTIARQTSSSRRFSARFCNGDWYQDNALLRK
jgi:hypothetical protein